MSSEKRLGRPGFSGKREPPLERQTGYNYVEKNSAPGCGHRLYRSIQRFRSGSDTSPSPAKEAVTETASPSPSPAKTHRRQRVEARRKARQTHREARKEARKGEATPTPTGAAATPTPKQ